MTETELYRPSNGTEGMDFMDRFCHRCELDRKFRETQDGKYGCEIVARALAFGIDDPDYPQEWRIPKGSVFDPFCTAFEEAKP